MVLRDHNGEEIFTACRWIFNCPGPLEAGLAACEEGLRLALHWSDKPLMVESDCAELISLISAGTADRSSNMFQAAEILELLKERQSQIQKISRTQNKAADAMAAIGRRQQRTTCWLANIPQEISIIIMNDCKTVIN